MELGQRVHFVPHAFLSEKSGTGLGTHPVPRAVTGVISYINGAHRYYTVTYSVHGMRMLESFKF